MDPQDPVLVEALQRMRVRWVIRQKVRTAEKSWLVDLYEGEYERPMRDSYDRLVRDHPAAYFELVAVMHVETCVSFTPFRG